MLVDPLYRFLSSSARVLSCSLPMAPVIVIRAGRPVMAVAGIGSSVVPETVRMVAGIPRNGDELQDILAAPPILFNFEPQENPLAAQPVLVPQGAYGSSMFDELGVRSAESRRYSTTMVTIIRG
jgi:gamma-glutamyltranspeptidase